MGWDDLFALPRPRPDLRIAYGPATQNVGDLWLPAASSAPPPPPLVAMIHGGCWTKAVANRSLMNWAAGDLRARGWAVWNIEYRGVDEPGGGYPGTFEDVGLALDFVPRLAAEHDLDAGRVVVLGHSAGGHLALWAAARGRLPRASPLRTPDPFRPSAVLDLAGVADLKACGLTACGADVQARIAGPAGPDRPDPFADTSPFELAPLGLPQTVLHGSEDETVPLALGLAYARRARALGDRVEVLAPPGGHVEEIAPGTAAWLAAVEALGRLVPAPGEEAAAAGGPSGEGSASRG